MTRTKLSIMIGLIFLGISICFIQSVQGTIRQTTISDYAFQDSVTSSGLPDVPIGAIQNTTAAGYNIAGNYLEAYFQFNLTNKPTNFLKAELSLWLWDKAFSGPDLNLTIVLIEDSWDELTLTLNNAPSKGQVMGNILYINNNGGLHKLDITSFVQARTNISVCVYMEAGNFVNNSADMYSSEFYHLAEQIPQIIWTFEKDATIEVINPLSSSQLYVNYIGNYSISWTSEGQIYYVKIELCEDFTPIGVISSNHPNEGEYQWIIPANTSSGDYRIKISDAFDPSVYGYSDLFSISKPTLGPKILSYPIILSIVIISLVGLILRRSVKKKLFIGN